MAKQANVNLTPATGAVAMFDLRQFLLNQLGFIIIAESDGTTKESNVVANGAQITTGVSGAGGMDNSLAWYLFSDPSGDREWVIQRASANSTSWRIKVSLDDGFTAGVGAATATVVPAAADEVVLLGTGTDAAPTMAAFFGAAGSYRWHLVGYDVAEAGVWPWYAYATFTATGNGSTVLGCESLYAGTYPALVGTRATPTSGESDPCIYLCGYNSSSGVFSTSTPGPAPTSATSVSNTIFWARHALNGSNGEVDTPLYWRSGVMGTGGSINLAPHNGAGGIGPNPLSSAGDTAYPMVIGRSSSDGTPAYDRGWTRHIKWKGPNRNYPDYVDMTEASVTERYAYMGLMLMPFDDAAVPSL